MSDSVIFSSAIFTGTSNNTISGGIAITGNKIDITGSREKISTLINDSTQVYELGDAFIVPGFCDAHAHFMEGAIMSSDHFCNSLNAAASEEECALMMAHFAEKYPNLPRYFGYGWLPAYWGKNANFPSKRTLDRYFPDKPVYLRAVDGHSEWLNSKALEESGYTRDWIPRYGHVEKYENGELSGLVREKADSLARKFDTRLPDDEVEVLQKKLIKQMNEKGITSCTEMSAVLPEEIDDYYKYAKRFEDNGTLSLRLFLYPGTDLDPDPERIAQVKPYVEKYNSDLLKIAGLKGFADGVTSTYTAAVLEPYLDRPDTCGELNHSKEQYYEWVREANRQGFSVRIHCIGDRAVKTILDACEASNIVNNNQNIRNTIEHIEVIDPYDIPRFKALNVVPSMQPLHLPLDRFDKLYRMGKERSRNEWSLKTIVKSGAILAAGTDYPVADFDPIPNIYMAVTRKGLDGIQYGRESLNEKLSVAEMIRAYTFGGAYATHTEDRLGTIEAGKFADLAVLDKNLLNIDPEEILSSKVIMTMMNGKVVYKKGGEI